MVDHVPVPLPAQNGARLVEAAVEGARRRVQGRREEFHRKILADVRTDMTLRAQDQLVMVFLRACKVI